MSNRKWTSIEKAEIAIAALPRDGSVSKLVDHGDGLTGRMAFAWHDILLDNAHLLFDDDSWNTAREKASLGLAAIISDDVCHKLHSGSGVFARSDIESYKQTIINDAHKLFERDFLKSDKPASKAPTELPDLLRKMSDVVIAHIDAKFAELSNAANTKEVVNYGKRIDDAIDEGLCDAKISGYTNTSPINKPDYELPKPTLDLSQPRTWFARLKRWMLPSEHERGYVYNLSDCVVRVLDHNGTDLETVVAEPPVFAGCGGGSSNLGSNTGCSDLPVITFSRSNLLHQSCDQDTRSRKLPDNIVKLIRDKSYAQTRKILRKLGFVVLSDIVSNGSDCKDKLTTFNRNLWYKSLRVRKHPIPFKYGRWVFWLRSEIEEFASKYERGEI